MIAPDPTSIGASGALQERALIDSVTAILATTPSYARTCWVLGRPSTPFAKQFLTGLAAARVKIDEAEAPSAPPQDGYALVLDARPPASTARIDALGAGLAALAAGGVYILDAPEIPDTSGLSALTAFVGIFSIAAGAGAGEGLVGLDPSGDSVLRRQALQLELKLLAVSAEISPSYAALRIGARASAPVFQASDLLVQPNPGARHPGATSAEQHIAWQSEQLRSLVEKVKAQASTIAAQDREIEALSGVVRAPKFGPDVATSLAVQPAPPPALDLRQLPLSVRAHLRLLRYLHDFMGRR